MSEALTLQERREIALCSGEGLGVVPFRAQLAQKPADHKRDFAKYTAAQVNEKAAFRALLCELCKTVDQPVQVIGRRRLPLADMVWAVVYRSYIGLSSRRFVTDMRDAYTAGFIDVVPSHNSVTTYLKRESLTPLLQSLISGIAASFAHIESNFAVDASGFRIPRVSKWYDAKWGWRERREWMKCHISVGVKTHIIAAASITPRSVMDHAELVPLVERTARQFPVETVSADSAYSIVANLEYVDSLNALPAIPFKSGANPFRHAPTSVWFKLFHLCALNGADWQTAVNQQNQAESTFSQIKRRFGEKVFSKDETAQVNEILCKVICHNLCVVLYWLYEFGVDVPEQPLNEVSLEALNAS